ARRDLLPQLGVVPRHRLDGRGLRLRRRRRGGLRRGGGRGRLGFFRLILFTAGERRAPSQYTEEGDGEEDAGADGRTLLTCSREMLHRPTYSQPRAERTRR